MRSRPRNDRFLFRFERLRMTSAAMIVLASLFVMPHASFGIPASPHPFVVMQPDGTKITLRIRGDERFHWMEDLDGYTVVRDRNRYVYAQLDVRRRLAATAWEVGKVFPQVVGLKRRLLPPSGVIAQLRAEALPVSGALKNVPAPNLRAFASSGVVPNVVILMRFTNHVGRTLPSVSDYDTLFNAVGGDPTLAPTGSVRDVYLENSYGLLEINSTVFAWVDLPNSEQYYADGQSGLSTKIWEAITDALNLADPLIDFSLFDTDANGFVDAIAFVHSGFGAEWSGVDEDGTPQSDRIWSHRWSIPVWTSAEGVSVSAYHINPGLWGTSGTGIGHIGVICHETGHFFGLPDLYDTNGGGEGIGSYGLMANSWGFTGNQLNPPHFCAWSKIQLGWITPTVISTPGVYQVPQVKDTPLVFRIDQGYPSGEYLLIENRQPVGIESTMPQGGLCIWHIDEAKFNNTDEGYPGQSGWPGNNNHYKIALLQADGGYGLEKGRNRGDGGDVFHGNGVDRIDASTVPNTDAYQSGNVFSTYNSIAGISPAGATMSFTYDNTVPSILHVDNSATGANNGLDWTNAFDNLQDALSAAVSLAPAVSEIWVAAGTGPYLPDPSGDRAAVFQLLDNIAIYGGFAGTETLRSERDPAVNVTTLSGDLSGDDPAGADPFANNADNSIHVVSGFGNNASAILDGFTITAGNADGVLLNGSGGGLYNDTGNPTVRGCVFLYNSAKDYGGGVYNSGNSAMTERCSFLGNKAGIFGGGAHNANLSTASFVNCLFVGNTGGGGGALSVDNSSPVLSHATVVANVASVGGGILSTSGSPVVNNGILWNNADAGGTNASAQFHVFAGTPTVNYSCVQGTWTAAGTNNIDTDPNFVLLPDPGPDGQWDGVDDSYGNVRVTGGSPCIDAGDNDAVPVGVTTDRVGNNRFVDDPATIDSGNAGLPGPPVVDMGAYEYPAGVAADLDFDGDVDANDFLTFSNCFNGALHPPTPVCPNVNSDLNGDGDVDANDFLTFSNCFNGSANPPGCP